MSASRESIKKQKQTEHKRDCTLNVQPGCAFINTIFFHSKNDKHRCDRRDRQVDEKDPAPTPVLNDNDAGQGTKDRSDAPNAADDSLHLGALLGCEKNADDDKRQRIDGAAAETLNGAEQNHHFHTWRRAAEVRAEDKDADPDQHQTAAADEIREFSEERSGKRGGQHVNRENPTVKLQAAQPGDDG